MARQRRGSNVSNTSSMPVERGDQVRYPLASIAPGLGYTLIMIVSIGAGEHV